MNRFIRFALCLSLICAPFQAAATVFWTTTWDEDPAVITAYPGGWWDNSCGGTAWPLTSNPYISNLRAFSGTKSLKHHFYGHQPYAGGCYVDRWYPASDEVWFTYWEWMDTGFLTDTPGTKALKPGDNHGSHWWGYMWNSRQLAFTCQACKDAQEGAYGSENYYPNMATFNMPDNTWVCYELHLKYNTPGQKNAVYEGFATPYGGQTVQFAGHYNREWRGTSTTDPLPSNTQFAFMREYVQDGIGELYRDDHTVSTTRVGCGNGVPPPPPPPVDTQAPTVPAGLSAQAASSSQINLTWNASTDNTGVTGYRIFRAGAQIATTAGTSYSNTGLTASTAYSYTVAAYDAAGNASAQSAAASATTPAAPPPGPSGLLVDFGASAAANTFGLAGWNTVIKDVYTTYQSAGPGGTMSGGNGGYDYQGVTGTARSFAAGDEIVVTWYNSGTAAATFTPQLSMTDPDRVDAGAVWHPMSSATIPAAGTTTTRFAFSAATAGSYSLVNVNVNMDYGALICDKIALVSAGAPADVLPPAKPRNMRVQ